jgi:hypothetical protein
MSGLALRVPRAWKRGKRAGPITTMCVAGALLFVSGGNAAAAPVPDIYPVLLSTSVSVALWPLWVRRFRGERFLSSATA